MGRVKGSQEGVAGRPGYPALMLFRALLLGQLCRLSCLQLANQIMRGLVFRRFFQIELDQSVPVAAAMLPAWAWLAMAAALMLAGWVWERVKDGGLARKNRSSGSFLVLNVQARLRAQDIDAAES